MPSSRSRAASWAFALAAGLAAWLDVSPGRAAPSGATPLQLEVFINNRPTKLVGAFLQREDGALMARRGELEDLGIRPPATGSADEPVDLRQLDSLSYAYDEPRQRLDIQASDVRLMPHRLDARGAVEDRPAPSAGYGAVLNYTLFAAGTAEMSRSPFAFSGGSAQLDGRMFSPYGTLNQTGILGTTVAQDRGALRLDTTFVYPDTDRAVTYRAGDVITRGPAWARSVRLGGLQAERNFALRSDLVTAPLPSLTGSAAVPSTVDVFINNVRAFSREVPAGPYEISNLPALSGNGAARVVLRDASGREVEKNLSLFSSTALLRGGLFDFSVQAGAPRLSYATSSFDYQTVPMAAGSLRYGATDWLTLEAHGEASGGAGGAGGVNLANGGLGLTTTAGEIGVLSAAGRASWYRETLGYQAYGSFETSIRGISLNLSTLRSFGDFEDLASLTARFVSAGQGATSSAGGLSRDTMASMMAGTMTSSGRPARALDRVSIGLPLSLTGGSLGLGYVSVRQENGTRARIMTASYAQNLWTTASLSATVFTDLDRPKDMGALLGFSMPLGLDEARASAGLALDRRGRSVPIEVSRALGSEPGSYGWRARVSPGDGEGLRSLKGSYRSGIGQAEASVDRAGQATRATVQAEGAVVAMADGVFVGNRIDDAFAVVNVGAPDVEVFRENRSVGRTGASGTLLVPGLASNQRNRITIDPTGLPLDAHLTTTHETVVPSERTGVPLTFNVKTQALSAVVILQDEAGMPLRPGSEGRLEGSGETFVVGYDGRAYILNLKASNTVVLDLPGRSCTAAFGYTPATGRQTTIGPVTCR